MSADIPPLVAHKITAEGRRILDMVSTILSLLDFLTPRRSISLSKKNVRAFVQFWYIPSLGLGMPCDAVARAQMAQMKSRWGVHAPVIDDLKEKAKKLGLWNMFLSRTHYKEGAALTNLEYALVAGILGKSGLASSVRSPIDISGHGFSVMLYILSI